MKWVIFFLFVGVLISSCKKNKTQNCFTVKYIDGICADNILQIVTPEFQYLGEDNWKCVKDNKVYDNVFSIRNYCEPLEYNADSTAMVYVTDEPINNNCIICLAVYGIKLPKALQVKNCK